jgi:hypothetical protein
VIGVYGIDWTDSAWLKAAREANECVARSTTPAAELETPPTGPLEQFRCRLELRSNGSFTLHNNGSLLVLPRLTIVGDTMQIVADCPVEARFVVGDESAEGRWETDGQELLLTYSDDAVGPSRLKRRGDGRAFLWREDKLGQVWLTRQ